MPPPVLLRATVVVFLALMTFWSGCGDGGKAERSALDSTLTYAEQLVGGGHELEARQFLLSNLAAQPGSWAGFSAPAAFRMLGDLSRSAALFDSAIAFYQRAGEAYRALARRDDAYAMGHAIAGLKRQMQCDEEALELHTEALRLATVFGDSAAARGIRGALLPVYRTLEIQDDEQKTVAVLLSDAQAHHDAGAEGGIHVEMGMSHLAAGDPNRAAGEFLRAVTLADQAGDSLLATRALLRVALALSDAGQTRDAGETFATALRHTGVLLAAPELRLELLLRVGNFYLRDHKSEAAERFYRAAVTTAHSTNNLVAEAYAGIQLGHCALGRSRDEANKQFLASFEQLRAQSHGRGVTYALVSMGVIAERANALADALLYYSKAAKEHDECLAVRSPDDVYAQCESAALGSAGADPYAAVIAILLQSGKPEEAFWYQSKKTRRALFDAMCVWRPHTGEGTVDSLLTEFLHQRAIHIGAEHQLEILSSSQPGNLPLLQQVQHVLRASTGAMSGIAERVVRLRPALEPAVAFDGIKPSEIQKFVPQGTVVLTYALTRRSVHVAAISKSRLVFSVSATGAERVVQLAKGFVGALARPGESADSLVQGKRLIDPPLQELTRGLYEALLLPIEGTLQAAARIQVVFPPELPLFPFQALRRGIGGGQPFLAERALVGFLPTVQSARVQAEPSGAVRDVLCLGFPGTTSWDVEYELRDVRAFYKDARLCFERDAAENILRTAPADLVHLAVEFQLGKSSPVRGGFFLSDGHTRTGFSRLPLGDLFGFRAHRALLVSNLAPHPPTIERGIPCAIRSTGTGTVMMNAFPLTRLAKKIFGEMFYTALLEGSTVTEAYRKAQVGMIRRRDTASPAMWAGFILWN